MTELFNTETGGVEGAQSKPEAVIRRRGPGRPFGSKNGTTGTVPPTGEQVPPPADSGAGPKPRRRRSKPVDTGEMAKKIEGMHMLLSIMTGIPEMQVSIKEAEMLAVAMADVSREFDFAPNGKATAVLTLLGTSAIVYLPRLGLLQARMVAKKKQQQKDQPIEGEVITPATPHGVDSGTAAAS